MKRVDIYSILLKNGYKLPKDWSNYMNVRADMGEFISNNIPMTKDLEYKIALYGDSEWGKLIRRLNNNGHVERGIDFENAIKESISQLNDYSQGNDNNVEVVTYEKGKRVTEKRSTWRVDEDLYAKVKDLAKKENKSMIDFVDDICLEISEGKHDELAKESKDRTKALAVHQSKTNLVKNHLKEIGSNVGVLTILEEIVNDRYIK